MNFPSSPSVFLIDDDHEDDHRQYFHGSRNFSHQPSTSYEMISRAEKKRKLTNQHQPSPMLIPHGQGPKRARNHPFDQGQMERSHSIQSGTEFEPILLDPEEYVIEEPETHSFHAFDWTLDQRRAATAMHSVPPRKAPLVPLLPPPPIQNLNTIDLRTTANLSRNSIERNEIRRQSSPIEQTLSQQAQAQQQQQQRRILLIPAGLPPTPTIPLPLPKPTATLSRQPPKRGRPAKIGRTHRSLDVSQNKFLSYQKMPFFRDFIVFYLFFSLLRFCYQIRKENK